MTFIPGNEHPEEWDEASELAAQSHIQNAVAYDLQRFRAALTRVVELEEDRDGYKEAYEQASDVLGIVHTQRDAALARAEAAEAENEKHNVECSKREGMIARLEAALTNIDTVTTYWDALGEP